MNLSSADAEIFLRFKEKQRKITHFIKQNLFLSNKKDKIKKLQYWHLANAFDLNILSFHLLFQINKNQK